MSDDQHSEDLVRLNRKLSRAAVQGKGIKITAEELNLMTAIGMTAVLSDAMAKALTVQAQARQKRDATMGIGHAASDHPLDRAAAQAKARFRQTFG